MAIEMGEQMTQVDRVKQDVFEITYEGTSVLSIGDLWPDGDAPENPTVADVKALMEKDGPKRRVLHDWCLEDDIEVRVGHGAYPNYESEPVWRS